MNLYTFAAPSRFYRLAGYAIPWLWALAIGVAGLDGTHTNIAVIETSGEGLCCGYDSGLPVTGDYQAPFRFTGRIAQVVVDVDVSRPPDADAQLRAAMNDQ